jgi:hypothetical protein
MSCQEGARRVMRVSRIRTVGMRVTIVLPSRGYAAVTACPCAGKMVTSIPASDGVWLKHRTLLGMEEGGGCSRAGDGSIA